MLYKGTGVNGPIGDNLAWQSEAMRDNASSERGGSAPCSASYLVHALRLNGWEESFSLFPVDTGNKMGPVCVCMDDGLHTKVGALEETTTTMLGDSAFDGRRHGMISGCGFSQYPLCLASIPRIRLDTFRGPFVRQASD